MADGFSRTRMLLGADALERLGSSRVAVFGLGGVGGHAVEALARSGGGTLVLVDNDTVSESNLTRQLLALHSTLGVLKTQAARARIRDICPETRVETYETFFLPETCRAFDFGGFDYVLDCIDTVTGKIQLALCAQEAGTPLLSCMGTGNRLDPTALRVGDLFSTAGDPLARVMRKELRRRGVPRLKTVYSLEPARTPGPAEEPPPPARRQIPGSTAFVPAAAGLLMAATAMADLLGGWERLPQCP